MCIRALVREIGGAPLTQGPLFFERGGSYIRTSVCEIGGLFVEEVGSYIKGPCPENRRALT